MVDVVADGAAVLSAVATSVAAIAALKAARHSSDSAESSRRATEALSRALLPDSFELSWQHLEFGGGMELRVIGSYVTTLEIRRHSSSGDRAVALH
jgi:hypothetical protein